MDELFSELTGIPDDKALTTAAYFHAKFENIHPFANGNDRVGRLMMNYILALHNHPPITIHEEDRKNYYEALEVYGTRARIWNRSALSCAGRRQRHGRSRPRM